MKNKTIRFLNFLLLIVMCLTSFSVMVIAYGENTDPELIPEIIEPTVEPTVSAEEPTTGGIPLTPDGNMTMVDNVEGEATEDKQFITVVSKNGNYFYIIIDQAGNGENTVHFLNQVDEADLLALMEEGQLEAAPIVCSCIGKCQAGSVKTDCEVCMANMSECVGEEVAPVQPTEPEIPADENKSSTGVILAVLLILATGAGATYYFLVMKPKQAKIVSPDLDDFDLEDEEEYLTEDEEME